MSVNKPKSGGLGKALSKIKGAFAFFSTLIGQIVFFLLAIILIGFLVYIVVSVILKDIAKLVGVDAGTQSNNESYEYLNNLASSGYDSMLNAQELMEYHAFEYAVLMDCARFMEETGTMHFEVTNSAKIKIEEYKDASWSTKRDIWAFMAAMALCKTPDDESAAYIDSTWEDFGFDAETPSGGDDGEDDGDSEGEQEGDFENITDGKFDTEHTDQHLKYYPVKNEYTNETSLYPYLEIKRDYDIVTYYIEFKDENNTALKNGVNFTLECPDVLKLPDPQIGNVPVNPNNMHTLTSRGSSSRQITTTATKGKLRKMPWLASSRFEYGTNPDYAGMEYAHAYILKYLFPLHICTELNLNNKHAFGSWDSRAGTGTLAELYGEYGESLYYTVQSAPTLHKIPLRILLDRFLPNAVLLSSWRILKDDASDVEDVVDKIQEIYSEACLEGETNKGSKLLIKDVGEVNYAINGDTNASQLFDKVVKVDTSLDKYLDGKDTYIVYDSYAPLFDSRVLVTNDDDEEDEEENPDENEQQEESEEGEEGEEGGEEGGEEPELGADAQQQFPGTFADDVIDDIKLALAHYSNNHNIITKDAYDKLMNDINEHVVPNQAEPKTKEDIIIYTPLSNGNYLANCKLGAGEKGSHLQGDGKTHINAANPYSASNSVQDCFVPFLKIAYTVKKGRRMTSVIINDRGEYTGYLIEGKEVADYSKLSNKKTFAVFETRDMQLTTVRHWRLTTTGEKSDEKWFVEDVFEGMKLGLGDSFTLVVNYKDTAGKKGTVEIDLSSNSMSIPEEDVDGIIGQMTVNGQSLKLGENTIEPGDTAIVRANEDPTNRTYTEEHLKLPEDASLKPEEVSKYPYPTTLSGGESEVLEDRFVNLKKLGCVEGQDVEVDASGIDFSQYLQVSQEEIQQWVIVYLYLKAAGMERTFSIEKVPTLIDQAIIWMKTIRQAEIEVEAYSVEMNNVSQEFAVVFPTRMSIIPIKQDFWDSKMTFYLVKKANLWSGVKVFYNKLDVAGEFKDRGEFMYLVNSNPYCKGLDGYHCTKAVDWRCSMFAPIFGGDGSTNTSARETDVLLILSEWLEASEQGLHAANHYIRDLYALINYSKGIKDDDGKELIPAYNNKKGDPYIHEGSYTYLYIPDEILKFDDTISEKAFWQDRLGCTPHDPIEQPEENYLRSKAETFTWQIVDYDLYEECQNGNGTASVYAFWMFGDTLSRTMYAIASNANDVQHEAVFSRWGDYAPGMHAAADLFGRNIVKKIYVEIFGPIDEPHDAYISTYFNETDSQNAADVNKVEKAEKIIKKAIKNYDIDLLDEIIDILLEAFPTKDVNDVEDESSEYQDYDEYQSLAMSESEKKKIKEEIIESATIGDTTTANSKITSIFIKSNLRLSTLIISAAGSDYVEDTGGGSASFGDTTSTAGISLFDKKDEVRFRLGGKNYIFNGVAAATYGYEAYRQTLILKDGEKAEEAIKEQLEREIKWTPLRAVAPGIVTDVKGDARCGFTVRIQHAEGVRTSYLHMKRFPLVQKGQYVGASTLLGYEGTTGNSGTFHVHFAIHKKGGIPQEAAFPVRYMYPFFNPFFYQEKAEEANYALDSEYMSTTRTVFPYGQVFYVGEPNEEYAVESDGGYVKIKNYVPTNSLVEDSRDIYYEDSGFEGYVDYSKLPTSKGSVYRNQKQASYSGQILKTNPCYFNARFIKAVIRNGYKIEGVEITWEDITSHDNEIYEEGDNNSNSGDSVSGEAA